MTAGRSPTLDRAAVERVVRAVVAQRLGRTGKGGNGQAPKLVVNISARHMHITQEHLEILFGRGAELTVMRKLYQDGEFASEQRVTIIGPRHRTISNLRILGPTRKYTQIELAFTDAIALGIDAPVRISGNHEGSPGCIVMGPKGHLVLEKGVIRAERHVHLHPSEAAYYGVKNKDRMRLRVESRCPVTFDGLVCRVDERVKCEVHVDTDEGNACDLPNATHVELLRS